MQTDETPCVEKCILLVLVRNAVFLVCLVFLLFKDYSVQPGFFHFNFNWNLWIFEATSYWGYCCLQVLTGWQTQGQERGLEERVLIF